MTSVNLNNLSIEELKKIKKDKQHKLKKEFYDYKQHKKKQKLLADIMAIEKQRKKFLKQNLILNQNQKKII